MNTTVPLTTRVSIGAGALESIPGILAQSNAGKRILLLTQPSVRERWSEPVLQQLIEKGYQSSLMELPDGEACKQNDVLLAVWQKLQELQLTRTDSIVAVGGGSLTDLAGFAASTYLRGIKLVLAPTTLLAQVDAAIGGKTGINLPSGKNLAGSFYFPIGVVADSFVLGTLPEREIKSGLGEIIKYAFIETTIADNTDYRRGPRSFFRVLEDILKGGNFVPEGPTIEGIVAASVKMKLAVVGKDPYEGRLRRCLNFGHTLAHALEKVTRFGLSHGEAVAIGCVFATKVAVARDVFEQEDLDRLIAMLQAAHLPVDVPADLSRDDLVAAMAFDKKKAGDNIKFVLPIKPLGSVDLDASLTLDELKGYL